MPLVWKMLKIHTQTNKKKSMYDNGALKHSIDDVKERRGWNWQSDGVFRPSSHTLDQFVSFLLSRVLFLHSKIFSYSFFFNIMNVSCRQSQDLYVSPVDLAHPNSTFTDSLHQPRWSQMKESEPSQVWLNRCQYCMTSYSDTMTTGWSWGWTQTKPFCSLHPQASWSLQPLFKHHPRNLLWFAGQLVCWRGQKVRLRFLFWPQVWADTQASLICLNPRMGSKTWPAAPHFLLESLKSSMDPPFTWVHTTYVMSLLL